MPDLKQSPKPAKIPFTSDPKLASARLIPEQYYSVLANQDAFMAGTVP